MSIDYQIRNPVPEFFCGLHSKIPFCCILWYIADFGDFNEKLNDIKSYVTKINGKKMWVAYWSQDSVWRFMETNYAMCPECLVNCVEGKIKPAILVKCNCSDRTGGR